MADRITGSVLDAGCGTEGNALFFAGRGCQVTGIDFMEAAINRREAKGSREGLGRRYGSVLERATQRRSANEKNAPGLRRDAMILASCYSIVCFL